MQYKVSAKHKDETIHKLQETQAALQAENLKLRTAESASQGMLSTLKDEVNREKIAKSNIQSELSKKEQLAANLKKSHNQERRKLLEECNLILDQYFTNRIFFSENTIENEF